MRKVIVVDGTFLKGTYLGTLLSATTQDGNFNIIPIAFTIVESENDEVREWFFRQLSIVIPDDEGLAIISDRHKSIGKAIGNVFPLARRGICTYHLHKNIVVKFRESETFSLVKKAARAFRLEEFNGYFQQIGALNPQLQNYLQRADLSMWTRFHIPRDRYNFTTSNIAESINRVINTARKYPILYLLDFIRSSKMNVQEIDPHHYEVHFGTSVNVVNLAQKTCTCRRFDLEKIPCDHAIAAVEKGKEELE
ncbi:uncharacterized protein LOC111829046 [Capsella rubella]|uniref:uncharacterized protein LOC111829046 n=1 Tax=Capsella rubella TaxID=81985 RepID=UPI000CD5438A|nr:uncharacterized protein LOC111829046 [Capsella rubella]